MKSISFVNKNLFKWSFLLILIGSLFIVLDLSFIELSKAHAYQTSCPEEIKDSPECLSFLQKQKELIDKEKQGISQELSNEQYQQLSLLEKINYLDSKIEKIQNEIDQLTVEIETKNVEISLLSKDIAELENSISTLSQEINRLRNSVDKRVSISYKYSFAGPLEIFLETKNFDTLLRRMKYLLETRKKDKELLADLSEKSSVLGSEEKVLNEKKKDVEKKRDQIEEEKKEQFDLKEELSAQRSERSSLYAESKRREAALLAELDAARKASSGVETAIIKWIQDHPETMINSGPVAAGTIIGQMGSTGCAYGAHLHFTISHSSKPLGYGDISPWSGYLSKGPDYWAKSGGWTYYYIHSGSMTTPLAGGAFLTQNHHYSYSGSGPYAIDISSPYGSGTSVMAARGGTLYKGTEPICGGKYARVVHSGGIETLYLHLKK